MARLLKVTLGRAPIIAVDRDQDARHAFAQFAGNLRPRGRVRGTGHIMAAATARKSMTFGEGGTAIAFTVLAFLCLIVAAKAYTPEYAFHAYLFAAGSVAAVFAILNRYFDRPAGAAAALHRRQAELQYGAGEVRDRRGDVLGHRGLHRRPLGGARARLSGAQFRSAVDLVRPHPAAAHLGGDLRVRRQRADRDLVLCRAAHLRARGSSATSRRGSWCSATTSSS